MLLHPLFVWTKKANFTFSTCSVTLYMTDIWVVILCCCTHPSRFTKSRKWTVSVGIVSLLLLCYFSVWCIQMLLLVPATYCVYFPSEKECLMDSSPTPNFKQIEPNLGCLPLNQSEISMESLIFYWSGNDESLRMAAVLGSKRSNAVKSAVNLDASSRPSNKISRGWCSKCLPKVCLIAYVL